MNYFAVWKLLGNSGDTRGARSPLLSYITPLHGPAVPGAFFSLMGGVLIIEVAISIGRLGYLEIHDSPEGYHVL